MSRSLFGTDGIRGAVGTVPFTPDALSRLGYALGTWMLNAYGQQPKVLFAHDTRQSCAWVKTTLQSGLLLHPITVHDAQVLPTPAVLQLMRHHLSGSSQGFDCGVVISASHNPYHDNGIKIIDTRTGKITAADEQAISDLFYQSPTSSQSLTSLQPTDSLAHHPMQHAQAFGSLQAWPDAGQQYIEHIVSLFPPRFLHGITVALDTAHGAPASVAQHIFERCGATAIVINNQPNGTNINDRCGALHPEQLQQVVRDHHAHSGFAFDGDGDRVIAVNSQGVVKNGDDLLALLSAHPKYAKGQVVVGTVMTNQGFEAFLTARHKTLIRTAVGDKYIAEKLESENWLLGGEQSGHIILRDYLPTGDGIVAALRTLEVLVATNNWAMDTFEVYPQVLVNVRVATKKDLGLAPLAQIIEQGRAQLNTGRVLVRYSGTEPVLRIMAEASSHDEAQRVVQFLSEKLSLALAS